MDSESLLLARSEPLIGVVDYLGRPIARSRSGRWTSALFIIGVEVTERFAFHGVSSNLVMYLTGPLREPTAAAAAAANTWSGAASMLPLLGALLADSCLGRYRTVVLASLLYVLGLGVLTFSAVLPSKCREAIDTTSCDPPAFRAVLFYFSLYLVAFAQGGHKPCVQAFGADQFDQNDPEERSSRSSFFNWWYFGTCAGSIFTVTILNYIQDNVGWGFGFGIPCVAMLIALAVFLLGTRTYRFYPMHDESPFARIGKSLAALVRSKRAGAFIPTSNECMENADHAEEAKDALRLFPIWASCLMYAVVFSQFSTFFTKQASTLDRRITSTLQVPPAALQSLINVSVAAFIPVYDRLIVPVSRNFSKIPSGITMLQRIGIGMVISLLSMVAAALVEMKRLKTASDYGLIDRPDAPIPMSLWWIIPQYVLVGAGDALAMVGLQEFFYDQVPDALRSLGLALCLSIFGIGSFISSFLVTVIDVASRKSGDSWFSDNLNRGHLDYFYWLLAGLSGLELVFYVYFAAGYVYKREENSIAR